MALLSKTAQFARSTAFALALIYVGLGLLAMACFALPLWYYWRVIFRDPIMESAREDAENLTQIYEERGHDRLEAFLTERIRLKIVGDRMFMFASPSYLPITGNIPAWPAGVPAESGSYTLTLKLRDRPLRVMLVRVNLNGGYNLLVARDVSHSGAVEQRFWIGLAGASFALLAVGLAGAFLVRRTVLLRINDINQSVSAIAGGNLSHRLPVSGRQDEFGTLARTINRMFDQIEQLLNGVRNVSNAVAHDLRTPLTQVRARLERCATQVGDQGSAPAEIDAAIDEVDHVIHIFNALLRLAEIDSGARHCAFVAVNLVDIAAGAVDFYRPVADERAITLSFEDEVEEIWLQGDSLLLSQALANLLDNALKFVPPGGRVAVAVSKHGEYGGEITVADDGPGIPASERSRVVERFYRVDASREQTPGIGLGLSLVEAVAKLHGGALLLVDNHPGLKAQMALGETTFGLNQDSVSHRPVPAA
jgi:signal transduction histidine kinase